MSNIVRLGVAWATVGAFLFFGDSWLAEGVSTSLAALLFLWIFVVMMWSSFGVIGEADTLAEILGEPAGSLVLAISIIVIEAVLIGAAILSSETNLTKGRDTLLAANMIMINLTGGLALLLGGLRHKEQDYNLQGSTAYLGVIIPMAVIGLILPSYTQAEPRGSVTTIQAAAIGVLTLFLYGVFLVLQMGRHKSFFMETGPSTTKVAAATPSGSVGKHSLMLVAGILPIVLLSGSLAKLIDKGIDILNAPPALGGFLIAILVVSPKAISAIKAGAANQPTRALNLALGSSAPALGLIVPVILGIGIVTGRTLIMGVGPADAILLATTLLLSVVTFSGPRTTVLEGAAHLVLFFMYLVLIFSP